MKYPILALALLAFCLTNCASYGRGITQSSLHQIRPGVTTEADLVTSFGPPDTRLAAYNGDILLDWFRSLGPTPASYAPIVGSFLGGLNVHVQQLTVKLSHSGRVRSYSIYDSDARLRSESRTRTTTASVYGK